MKGRALLVLGLALGVFLSACTAMSPEQATDIKGPALLRVTNEFTEGVQVFQNERLLQEIRPGYEWTLELYSYEASSRIRLYDRWQRHMYETYSFNPKPGSCWTMFLVGGGTRPQVAFRQEAYIVCLGG